MIKVVIFGLGDLAEMAHYYLTTDSDFKVVAFCVSEKFMPENKKYKGLPIVKFEEVEELFDSKIYKFFALTSSIETRKYIYNLIKSKGYGFISYISSKAEINNCKIGENCFVQELNSIQPFCEIGNNVMLYSCNNIAHHSVIKDFVTLGSHVVLSSNTIINQFCDIGANSTILYRVVLAEGTKIGIGSVITKNTEDWSIYMGSPAKKIGKKLGRSFNFNKIKNQH